VCETTAMMLVMTSGLETDRLRLDPLRRSDATEMVRVLGPPEKSAPLPGSSASRPKGRAMHARQLRR